MSEFYVDVFALARNKSGVDVHHNCDLLTVRPLLVEHARVVWIGYEAVALHRLPTVRFACHNAAASTHP